ncbi:hypothetical protein FSW04_14975 [Baekduia soli]|uniref:Uncharacterized protein n=1 Tax=Baekduia soli TaxID=496014 RepID=A0A5B8U6M7_9ACTN|nr:hypothetical protein [Baekduia soli]QEC48746.1 hypothetical protein FSW04_14975 [Baekduia soli]
MSVSFDIGELDREITALRSHPHLRKLVIVLPIEPDLRDMARDVLAEGPPFDLRAAGLDAHEVLLTDNEAIFVFGLPDGPPALERILAEEDFWTVVSSWERIAAGPPRIASVAFDWHAA